MICSCSLLIKMSPQACYKYYLSDDISKDNEGMDEQCRYNLFILIVIKYFFVTF